MPPSKHEKEEACKAVHLLDEFAPDRRARERRQLQSCGGFTRLAECVLAGSMIGMPFISSSKMQRHNVLSGQIRIRERIICPLIRAEASEEG
eukprot:s6543_g4.t1